MSRIFRIMVLILFLIYADILQACHCYTGGVCVDISCGLAVRNACVSGGGVLFQGGSSGADCAAFAPIPIELLDFSAILTIGHVEVKWVTLSETNNDRFDVYRSKNGIDWVFLSSIEGSGNSSNQINYETHDVNPYDGVSYYRLKQVDYDGTYKYSSIVVVDKLQRVSTSVLPNPNNGNFLLLIDKELKDDLSILITDQRGTVLYSMTILSGNSIQPISLDLKDKLSRGVYHLVGSSKVFVFSEKIVVL